MRKELIIAIVVGIIMGLIVTYGIYTANRAISRKQTIAGDSSSLIPTPSPTPPRDLSLEITSPENNLVVTRAQVTLEGTAPPNSVVIILTEEEELFVNVNENGKFSQPITLIKGANTIELAVSDTNKLSDVKTLNLVYTTQLNTTESDDEETE